jgi:hypothetical protein
MVLDELLSISHQTARTIAQNKEHKLEETFGSADAGRGARYSLRQLLANAAIAASRVSA